MNVFDNKKITKESLINHLPISIYNSLQEAFYSAKTRIPKKFFISLISSLKKQKETENNITLIYHNLVKAKLFKVLEYFIHFQNEQNLINMAAKDTKISCKETIEEYINKEDWRIKANANVSYSNASLINQTAGKIIANFWLDNVYSEEEMLSHRMADIHIHDLDSLTGYCAGWSLRVLLNEGFNGVLGRVSSRPPKHFNEALGQIANFLGVVQSEWAGAQALSSFDTYLAPYVFKDNLNFYQVKRLLRKFIYDLNMPTRWGQSPFTNITLDFKIPKDLQEQIPCINNEHLFENLQDDKEVLTRANARNVNSLKDLTYKNFQPEIEIIDQAFYEIMTEGDSNKQPFTFPIPTVNITEDFDWDSKAAKALFDNTAKMGSSYFQNFIGSQYVLDDKGNKIPNPEAYSPDSVRSMCCRLQLDLRELVKRGNGLFGSAEMTGSIGVTTINMARLGYKFKKDKKGLFDQLKYLMNLCKSVLEKRRKFVQEMYNRGLYPYTARYLKDFRNHFSTIGVNGMNEMLINFSDSAYDIASEQGIELCLEILEFMRKELKKYQEETGNLYNLEATPAEGATYRFAKEDKKYFPDIIQSGYSENIYYTNSSQLPVHFTDDPFKALEKQDKLQCKYTGGTVLHLYTNENFTSPIACKNFVKTVIENYKLPYITVSPTFSTCNKHGYLSGNQLECPYCGQKVLTWTRVMGYYRPVDSFNVGKKGEYEQRVYFKQNSSS